MFNFHKYQHYFGFLKKERNELYLMHFLESFVGSMIGMFIPIFLLNLGYSVAEVLLYYIVLFFALGIFFIILGYLSSIVGLKHLLLARIPFAILFFVLLAFLESLSIPILILAILQATKSALYWYPLHVLFSKNSQDGEIGKEVGILGALPRISSLAAPIIGGLLILSLGFLPVFLLSAFLLLFSALLLMQSGDVREKIDFRLRDMLRLFRSHSRYFLRNFCEFMESGIEEIVWPIFVYLTLSDILSVGFVKTLAGLGGIIVVLLIGRLADRKSKVLMVKFGAGLLAGMWLLRFLSTSAFFIYALTLLASIMRTLVIVPLDTVTYGLARKQDTEEMIVLRELFVDGARILTLTLALLVASNLKIAFTWAAFSSLILAFL